MKLDVPLMTETAYKEADDSRVLDAQNTAVRELDLMRQAIDDKQLKKALFHKKLANAAIDEMMLNNNMVEEKD